MVRYKFLGVKNKMKLNLLFSGSAVCTDSKKVYLKKEDVVLLEALHIK